MGSHNRAIRPVKESDAANIVAIYNNYVLETCVTFETEIIDAVQMVQRIRETFASQLPWLLAEDSGKIIGYAYASQWKGRWGYRYSVESTIYLDAAHTGKGVGPQLYAALIEAVRSCSMHAIIGGITLPNNASINLHECLGFKKVAHFEQVGYKQDRWVDVGYWQLLLT